MIITDVTNQGRVAYAEMVGGRIEIYETERSHKGININIQGAIMANGPYRGEFHARSKLDSPEIANESGKVSYNDQKETFR